MSLLITLSCCLLLIAAQLSPAGLQCGPRPKTRLQRRMRHRLRASRQPRQTNTGSHCRCIRHRSTCLGHPRLTPARIPPFPSLLSITATHRPLGPIPMSVPAIATPVVAATPAHCPRSTRTQVSRAHPSSSSTFPCCNMPQPRTAPTTHPYPSRDRHIRAPLRLGLPNDLTHPLCRALSHTHTLSLSLALRTRSLLFLIDTPCVLF